MTGAEKKFEFVISFMSIGPLSQGWVMMYWVEPAVTTVQLFSKIIRLISARIFLRSSTLKV